MSCSCEEEEARLCLVVLCADACVAAQSRRIVGQCSIRPYQPVELESRIPSLRSAMFLDNTKKSFHIQHAGDNECSS